MTRMRAARGLRLVAIALVAHGVLFWLANALQSLAPDRWEAAGMVMFWVLALPALLLASPFTALFWKLGLMDAPGWFAWPKPLALALAYAIWTLVLLALAEALRRLPDRGAR